MNDELFEKRILFESLSCIMQNQKIIMRHIGLRSYDFDGHTEDLIEQCNAIINKTVWEEEYES